VIGRKCPQCRLRTLLWNRSHSVYECLNSDCRQVYTANELRSINYYFLKNATLLTIPVIAGIGVAVYVLFHSFEIDLLLASAIAAAAVIIAFRNYSILKTLWRYRLQHAQLALVLFSVLFVGLMWCIAAAYTGIAPFSYAKEAITGEFAHSPQENDETTGLTLEATPTPEPLAVSADMDIPTPATTLTPIPTATPSPTPTGTPAPTPTPKATPTPTPSPTPTPDPIYMAFMELKARYIIAGDWDIPISLDSFTSLAQYYGIEEAVRYVASGRWDPRYPLNE